MIGSTPEGSNPVVTDKQQDLRQWIASELSRLIRTLLQIFGDLVITLSILFSLQAIHLILGRTSLPDWVKVTVSRIHDYSMIIVVALFAIEFVLRMAGRSFSVMVASFSNRASSTDES